jgi:cytochrome b involved in lipid metabolism
MLDHGISDQDTALFTNLGIRNERESNSPILNFFLQVHNISLPTFSFVSSDQVQLKIWLLYFKMSKSMSPAEVAEHATAENGMYIIVDDGIYDITSRFQSCSATRS